MKSRKPEMVQFSSGAYAIRRKAEYSNTYEYMGLDDGYWWSIGSGRQWYETMSKVKAQKAFDKLIAEAEKNEIGRIERENSKKDIGVPIKDIKSGGTKPQVYIGRQEGEKLKFKLPKMPKWFTD